MSTENNFGKGDLIYALGYPDAMLLSVVSEHISTVFRFWDWDTHK